MSRKTAEELLPRLRQRYTGRGREGRSRLIDGLCEQWGYSRKHAIKLLGARTGWGGNPGVRKTRVGHRGRCGTKPGGLLKTEIPIRTDNWDITRPGFLEADTVAHCGGSLAGDFVWSVTYCDI